MPVIIPRSGHPISRRMIDPSALKVLYRLYRAGHVAYLVGGGVRDLLLGLSPKDFDVATDAHPARIRKLFRNCVLIGRRFRLAHVRFGSTIIETSTFRRAPDPEAEGEEGDDLLIRRDNTFGTPEDDARRRDFTVNALFYDIGTYSIIDHVGGMADVEDGCIRSIGDPEVRYQEDPVRMLRAVKFAARLDFEIVEEDLAALKRRVDDISLASTPRLLEETYKFLRGSAAAPSFHMLHETGLLDRLLPEITGHLERSGATDDPENEAFYQYLFALDEEIGAGRTEGSNSLLLATLLLAPINQALVEQGGDDASCWTCPADEVEDAFEEVARPLFRRFGVARKDVDRLRGILLAQRRLLSRSRNRSGLERSSWLPDAVTVLGLQSRLEPDLEDRHAAWQERLEEIGPIEPERRERRRRRSRPRRRH